MALLACGLVASCRLTSVSVCPFAAGTILQDLSLVVRLRAYTAALAGTADLLSVDAPSTTLIAACRFGRFSLPDLFVSVSS